MFLGFLRNSGRFPTGLVVEDDQQAVGSPTMAGARWGMVERERIEEREGEGEERESVVRRERISKF